MSKVVDERVVEMRFDNQHFEKNVGTTMSTLDKLKQSLKLSDASKGLEKLNQAAGKVDMSPLSNGVEAVRLRFSAMYTMADQSLRDITTKVQNTATKMVNALTLDPIKTGFQEYETQMNAVQTILANTKSKGSDIDDVNVALKELNTYADQTIYNFTEMTRNIGTFTAAGVDLDTSVSAIKGIANLAAVSGSTSQQASTAMYQLSQALSSGTVKLQDWNSVVNAGMGGEVFQNALKRTATNMGVDVDGLIKKYGSFRESLTQGEWVTTDVLTETLNQFTMAAKEGSEEWKAYKAELQKKGYTDDQIKEILDMANTATDAATKVKTFTQLWDVMKESAQSGWSQTWQLLVGDFEQAKNLLSPLADFFTGDNGIITLMSNARNTLLEGALGKSFKDLGEKISGVVKPITQTTEAIKGVVKTAEEYSKVADQVISGKWGTGQKRWDTLTKEGYDWAHTQNLINEKLGDSTRHQTKYKEATKETAKATKEAADATEKLNEADKQHLKRLFNLNEEQLRYQGYSEEQIKSMNELRDLSEKLGIPMGELIDNLDEINGRWLLWNSLKNIGLSIVNVFKAIGVAWRDAFPAMQADTLFNIIVGFHKFSSMLVMGSDTADKFTRTLKGVFAILDIISTLTGSVLGIGVDIIKALFSALGIVDLSGILDLTAAMGDSIVAVRDWIEEHNILKKAINAVVPYIVKMASVVWDFMQKLYYSEEVQAGIAKIMHEFERLGSYIKTNFIKIVDKIKQAFNKLADNKDIIADMFAGFMSGISENARPVINKIIEFITKFIDAVKDTLGIHSPSTVFIEIGKYLMMGLSGGIEAGLKWVIDAVKNIFESLTGAFSNTDLDLSFSDSISGAFEQIKEVFKSFDYKKLAAAVPIMTVLLVMKRMSDASKKIAKGTDEFNTNVRNIMSALVNGVGGFNRGINAFVDVGENLSKAVKSFAFDTRMEGLKKLAMAIGILTLCVIAISFIKTEDLIKSVATISILALVLGGLAFAVSKMSDSSVKLNKEGLSIDGVKTTLISIAAALLILAVVVKIIGSMSVGQAIQGFVGLAAMIGAMYVLLLGFKHLSKDKGLDGFDKLGGMMIKLSVAMLLMIAVCKLVNTLSVDDAIKGAMFVTAFVAFIKAITFVTTIGKDDQIAKLGGMMVKLSVAMLLMVGVCKLAGMLTPDEISSGIAFAFGIVVLVGALRIAASSGSDKTIAKLGGLLLAMSVSMMMMIGVCKLVDTLSLTEIVKGVAFIAGFIVMIKILVSILTIGKEEQVVKAAGMILAMSVAIALMAGIAILLSLMPLDMLAKGVGAVAVLGLVMAAMIAATKGATNVKAEIIALTVAIGVMAVAVAILASIKTEKLLASAGALVALMGMFSLMAVTAKSLKKDALLGIAVLTLVVGSLAGILYLMSQMPIQTTIANAAALSILLVAMSGVCVILSKIGAGAGAAIAGAGAMAAVIAIIIGTIALIGAVAPKIESFVDKGIGLLVKMAYGLGEVIGAIIGGFASGVASGLPDIGTHLSDFMNNASDFIEGANGIDKSVIDGVSSLVSCFLLLTGADLVDKLTSWLTGGTSFTDFGEQLKEFAPYIKSFADAVVGIDAEAVVASANAAKALAEMASIIPNEGGLLSNIVGDNSLDKFGENLVKFGAGMMMYGASIKGLNVEDITASVNAAKGLVEIAKTIPNTGGLLAEFTGDNDMGTFSTDLVQFGTGMMLYGKSVENLNAEAIAASVKAAESLVGVAKTIPNTGGILAEFAGDNDLSTFGTDLVLFGAGMLLYGNSVNGLNVEAIAASVKAAESLSSLSSKLDNMGGVVSWFTGDNDLSTFGKKLVEFGKAMSDYENSLENIDNARLSGATAQFTKIVDLAKSVEGVDFKGMASFGESLENLSLSAIDKFIAAFSNSHEKAKVAISTFVSVIIEAVNSKKKALDRAFKKMATEAASAMSAHKDNFKDSGKDFAQGLINGLRDPLKLLEVYNAAYALGQKAVQGEKDGQDSASPSKETYQAGLWLGEGLVNGMVAMGNKVYDAGHNIGEEATNAISNTVSRIAEAINTDIDSQPTIRPVLDLSDIQNGASSINGMLGLSPSVSALATANGINLRMNSRRQNGVNDDVVNAIDRLNGRLDNVGGTSYNINGITYSDGSDVSNAIETIVRAIKIEGRM